MKPEFLEDSASSPGLHRPPDRSCYIDLPESFGRRFAIFVDTEEEFDWAQPPRRDAHGTRAAESLPTAHRRLREAGVKPVYLIDYPIATDPRCIATLREYLEAGECTVGTQLHPWVNPPFDEELSRPNSFAGNLPVAVERAKLLRLTDAIESGFGRRPTAYRAGRYGVGPNTAELLAEAGYEVDVSVRPFHDHSGEGGADFTGFEPRPFWALDGRLLELPLTAGFIGVFRGFGSSLYPLAAKVPRARGLLSRSGLLERIALTPEGMPISKVRDAIDRLIDDGVRLFTISFHSPSLEPGNTPYVRDEADLDLFYAWWDGIFDFMARRGILPADLQEIVAAARQARGEG